MAAERKENSVLFTLKELKDITADQPAPAARPVAQAPAKKSSSFIDDAESLLADIRGSVDEEAAAEAARLEAQRVQAEEAERRAREQEDAQRRAEVEARLAAEEARRRAAAEEREAKARAIDRAERIARGEIVDEPEPVQPVFAQVVQPQAPAEPQGRGTGFYLVVVGLPVLCLTAVAIVLILRPVEQPKPVATVPAVTELPPVTPPPPAAAVAALDDEEPDAAPPDASPPDAAPEKVAAKKSRRARRKAGGGDKKADGDGASGEKKKLNLKLGGDGITF
ncbi:MAG: hypothetical protein KC620_11320 [Myxococcales bacterium]|nr:hypothetical protein [Myxococcales bacterium]